MTYREQTRDDLRDELKSRGLSPAGTKAELIARLYEYDEMHQDDDAAGGNGDGESGGEQPSGTHAVKEAFADYLPTGSEDAGNGSGNGHEARGTERSATREDTSAPAAEEGDADDEPEESEFSGNGGRASGRRGGMTAMDAARAAADQLAALIGRRPDSITGLRPVDGGWRVLIELVEVARIPPSTDVLGTYEVQVDAGGALQLYERVRRYMRAER